MSRGGGPPISSSTPGWKAYIPAFTRSETGLLGFSSKPTTVPAASSSTTPPADGRSEWKTVSVAIAPCSRCVSDQGAQVEIGEVVGVAGQEHLFSVDPGPVGGERAGAAEQFRLEERAHGRAARLAHRGGGAPRPAGGAG